MIEVFKEIYDEMKKIKYIKTIKYILIFVIIIISYLNGCSYLNKKFGLQDDNIIEEYIEDIIESQTDLHIDLTLLS